MIVKFDCLDRYEVPNFHVCSPGSKYTKSGLTNSLGCLSGTTDEEIVMNFNSTSELSFRIYLKEENTDDETAYVTMLFNALQKRRLIFIDDIGYFVVDSIDDGSEGGLRYKDVTALSCEVELQEKMLPFINDGTYRFVDLFETIVSTLPIWTIGDIDGAVANRYRTFEDVPTDANVLAFLLEDMQDAYECIFTFDTVNRIINVQDQNNFVTETEIHITKNDVVNSIMITEGTDDLYTAITVHGDEDLNISPINPLGANTIYNFDYYLEWMQPELRDRVIAWQSLIEEKEKPYYDLNLSYYKKLTDRSNLESNVKKLEIQIDMYQRCRDNIIADGGTVTVESYNEVIEKNGGVPVGIQDDLAETVAGIEDLISDAMRELEDTNRSIANIGTQIEDVNNDILAIHNQLSITKYFTTAEYFDLSHYIYEGEYTDEYIAVTSIMSYEERFGQMKTLYDRSKIQLGRLSKPTQEFSIDVENFIFSKDFSRWSDQLETGRLVNVEIADGDVAMLFLSSFAINYHDQSLKLTFGNRFKRFDQKELLNGFLGDIKRSANSVNFMKDILYPVKNGEFDQMKEAIESSGILTKDVYMASKNQEFIIDDTGILGRRLLDNGEFDLKQSKLTNHGIVFTVDGWASASTALGEYLYNNPITGTVETRFGIIANSIVGDIMLGRNVSVFNESGSIVLDNNGFVLTSDFRDPSRPASTIFTIQKLLKDSNGDEYYSKQMFIDSDGNLVVNGSLGVYTSDGRTTGLESFTKTTTATAVNDLSMSVDGKMNTLSDSVNSKVDDLSASVDVRVDDLTVSISNMPGQIMSSVTEKVNSLSQMMSDQYAQTIQSINDRIEKYEADIGQFMTFGANGLTLGASGSAFKTVIDNRSIAFYSGDTAVSWVDGKQLYIPNAVITNTMTLGKFFFVPREDGGFSLTWQG